MRKKLAVFAVYGVVTAAVVVGVSAYVVTDKTVAVSLDGKLSRVHTFAGTVGGALRRAGITVGAHDSVEPTLQTRLRDDATITILRGRRVSLTVDGSTRDVWVTASSVQGVLQQVGLRTSGEVVSANRFARVPLTGMTIAVNLPHTVTVQVDGSAHAIVSTKATVREVLADAGIAVNPADQLSVPLDTRPVDGLAVVIVRISSGQQLERASIPFTTVTKPDPNSLVGTKKVGQHGVDGTLVRTYKLAFADGKQTAKTLISQQVSVPPIPQVILIGTKPKPKPKPVVRVYPVKVDGLDWPALARCESGGRANANNGRFYGLYQFSLATWRAVGGQGLPSDASPSEQTYRAQLLYSRSNWQHQWPVCGHVLFH